MGAIPASRGLQAVKTCPVWVGGDGPEPHALPAVRANEENAHWSHAASRQMAWTGLHCFRDQVQRVPSCWRAFPGPSIRALVVPSSPRLPASLAPSAGLERCCLLGPHLPPGDSARPPPAPRGGPTPGPRRQLHWPLSLRDPATAPGATCTQPASGHGAPAGRDPAPSVTSPGTGTRFVLNIQLKHEWEYPRRTHPPLKAHCAPVATLGTRNTQVVQGTHWVLRAWASGGGG